MITRWHSIAWALALGGLLLVGCGRPSSPGSADKLNITVSIVPQKYFVERIAGERVVVNVMVLPGNNPATYEPKPEQLTALSEAVAYFSIGVPFEEVWLDKIAAANDRMMMVDTAAGIRRVPVDGHYKVELGGLPESDAEGRDPHIWLSPSLVKIQAQNIYRALAELDPARKTEYEVNLNRFIEDIDDLITDVRETLADVPNRKFIVFHPAWGYFGDDFELEMIPIEVGGQEPSAAELADLITVAREEGIKVIFAQPEFSTQKAEVIAREIGGEVVLINPLAEDWLGNMRLVADTFARVLSESG